MPLDVEVSFASVQRYIINQKCITCHNGPGSKGADLSSYESMMLGQVVPGKPLESKLYQSLASGAMPKGMAPLRSEELALVYEWIAAGAKKDGAIEPPPPPPEPTFEWISKYVFNRRCVSCHDGKHAKTKLDLRTYDALMSFEGELLNAVEKGDPELSSLFINVNDGTMPPKEVGTKIPKAEIDAIFGWIKDGAKP